MTCKPGSPFYDMKRADGVPPRWVAVVYYRTTNGMLDVEHQIEELDMLHDLIERGPDFNAIERIEIRHARASQKAGSNLAWCSTCGKETTGPVECEVCRRWWDSNPQPNAR